MKKMGVPLIAALLAAPLFSTVVSASWFSHNSNVRSTTITIPYNTTLMNGKTLAAGRYKLEIPLKAKSPDLEFYRDGKLVVSVPARVKTESQVPQSTQINYTRKGKAQYMTEIELGGSSQAYVLTGSSGTKAGA